MSNSQPARLVDPPEAGFLIEVPEPPVPQLDWVLQQLVRMANERVVEMPVTLHVHGVVVSGYIVGGQQFFDRWADEIASGMTGDTESSSDLKRSLASFGSNYPSRDLAERTEAGEDVDLPSDPQFIHLRDARFLSGTEFLPTNRPLLWRARLAAVDAFFVGILGVPE